MFSILGNLTRDLWHNVVGKISNLISLNLILLDFQWLFILNSKVPEDENKREREDKEFEDQEEVDMNDETYGQNEPPEPEDLDMNADDEIGDGDNDNDENPDELPSEVLFWKHK